MYLLRRAAWPGVPTPVACPSYADPLPCGRLTQELVVGLPLSKSDRRLYATWKTTAADFGAILLESCYGLRALSLHSQGQPGTPRPGRAADIAKRLDPQSDPTGVYLSDFLAFPVPAPRCPSGPACTGLNRNVTHQPVRTAGRDPSRDTGPWCAGVSWAGGARHPCAQSAASGLLPVGGIYSLSLPSWPSRPNRKLKDLDF